ncbi:MAG TPA: hypothetical protein VMT85_06685 [Thermoanaerobaculia bacterium]|nr:hypothetical protein [Thermoanaerobaculia bacterium]
MLSNRADTYNLGDILSGMDELFALSYPENSLTSNTTLQPLAARDPEDLLPLVRMASGEQIAADELKHPYDAAEIEELVAVLEKMIRVQQVLLAVNRAYIASASMADAESASAPAPSATPAAIAPSAPAPQIELEPYLERLDATLAALAHKPAGVAVMQPLGPGVLDLLTDQVDDALLPLIQGLGRRLDALQLDDDRGTSDLLDKSLKRLDELKELVVALRKIDTGRVAGEGGIGR